MLANQRVREQGLRRPGISQKGIGARVAGLAGPGEVLVSQAVRDLVAGSPFEERGTHMLKGVPNEWHLSAPLLNKSLVSLPAIADGVIE
jgi:class 3 adenylate cyclase